VRVMQNATRLQSTTRKACSKISILPRGETVTPPRFLPFCLPHKRFGTLLAETPISGGLIRAAQEFS